MAGDDIDAEIWEIDENLIRSELSAGQVAEHLKRRKDLFEARNFERNPPETPKVVGRPIGFAKDAEAKSGMAQRTINEAISRAERLGPDLLAGCHQGIKRIPHRSGSDHPEW